MPKPNVLALVMAGEGNRLELLTERRAKPTLSFAGVYRLIDGVRVGPDALVGRAGDDGEPTLVGEEARVARGAAVAPGDRYAREGTGGPAA